MLLSLVPRLLITGRMQEETEGTLAGQTIAGPVS